MKNIDPLSVQDRRFVALLYHNQNLMTEFKEYLLQKDSHKYFRYPGAEMIFRIISAKYKEHGQVPSKEELEFLLDQELGKRKTVLIDADSYKEDLDDILNLDVTGVTEQEFREFLISHEKCSLATLIQDPKKSTDEQIESAEKTLAKMRTLKNGAAAPLQTAKQVLGEEGEITWLVHRIFQRGALSLLVGDPKAGKTTFAMDLACSVASGSSFLNHDIQMGKVLYYALDGPKTTYRKRFSDLGIIDSDNLFVITECQPKRLAKDITGYVRENNLSLVIIDVLGNVANDLSFNEYNEVMKAFAPLKKAVDGTNCHLMILHHARKNNESKEIHAAIGSNAFGGSVDNVLVLRERSGIRTLSARPREGDDINGLVIERQENGSLLAVGTVQEAAYQDLSKRILEMLGNSEHTKDEIFEAVGGRKENFLRVFNGMVESGTLSKAGTGKKGDPVRYGQTKLSLNNPKIKPWRTSEYEDLGNPGTRNGETAWLGQ